MIQLPNLKTGIVLLAAIGISLLGGGASYVYLVSIGPPDSAGTAQERSDAVPGLASEAPAATVPATWFDDLAGTAPISPRDQRFLVRQVAGAVFTGNTAPIDLPGTLTGDAKPRIVFLSLSDGRSRARVLRGQGRGIGAAIEQALSQVPTLGLASKSRWLKLDFVEQVRAHAPYDLRKALPLEKGLTGLAFERRTNVALLAEELLANRLVSKQGRLRGDWLRLYADAQSSSDPRQLDFTSGNSTTIYTFKTSSYFSDGEQVLPMYRGHRLSPDLSRETLLASATQAGDYLERAVGPEGKFVYSYSAKRDAVRDSYNILRHSGTLYAMLELYEVTGDGRLLDAVERGIRYLLTFVRDCRTPQGQAVACVVERGAVKLGGNALAIIALTKYMDATGDRRHLPTAVRLAEWIHGVQGSNGAFTIHKQVYPSGAVDDFRSRFYPGEAILALVRLHRVEGSTRWLDTAERAAQFLINVRDRGVPQSRLKPDHWLLYGLRELHRYRREQLYLDHALRIAHAMVQGQDLQPPYRDWLGSYGRPPRSTRTATRSEGLYAAYRLARNNGRGRDAEVFLGALRRGIQFQLQTQFQPESVMYLPDPQRALGGFHRSLTHYEVRIDYVQHNISGILGLMRIMAESRPAG